MGKKLTTEEFIEKALSVHKDKYNYSKVDYVKSKLKVCIICPEHGEFWQTPNSHLLGKGCPICALKNKPQCKPKTTELFVEEAKKIHDNFYDYSKTKYVTAKTKIIITCPIHGDFTLTPNAHLSGLGCPKCSNKNITTREFIEKAEKVHNYKYNYIKTIYKTSHDPIIITCPIHGDFLLRPCDHIHSKQGCPECSSSKGEAQIAKILDGLKINYTRLQMIYTLNRKFYIDFSFSFNGQLLFIEYNGVLHYMPIEFFGGKLLFDKLVERDSIVRKYCLEHNIKLIEIRYDENIEKVLMNVLNDYPCEVTCKRN